MLKNMTWTHVWHWRPWLQFFLQQKMPKHPKHSVKRVLPETSFACWSQHSFETHNKHSHNMRSQVWVKFEVEGNKSCSNMHGKCYQRLWNELALGAELKRATSWLHSKAVSAHTWRKETKKIIFLVRMLHRIHRFFSSIVTDNTWHDDFNATLYVNDYSQNSHPPCIASRAQY